MKSRNVRRSTRAQRGSPAIINNVIVIEPRTPRGSMWEFYKFDNHQILQELFDDHNNYLDKHDANNFWSVRFTAFPLRERGIPIFKLALVFHDLVTLDRFITKSHFSFGDVEAAEWNVIAGEKCEFYLEGKAEQIEKANADLVMCQNVIVF